MFCQLSLQVLCVESTARRRDIGPLVRKDHYYNLLPSPGTETSLQFVDNSTVGMLVQGVPLGPLETLPHPETEQHAAQLRGGGQRGRAHGGHLPRGVPTSPTPGLDTLLRLSKVDEISFE